MRKATSLTNGHSPRTLPPHHAQIRSLSDRLVDAQRPIRILDAIKWDDGIERAFFAKGCKELPPVTAEYYAGRPLPFDAQAKVDEFRAIDRDIRRQLGRYNAAGQIMTRMCQEYRDVVHMLAARGTPAFVEASERLYGSPADRFHAGEPNVGDLGQLMATALDNLAQEAHFEPE